MATDAQEQQCTRFSSGIKRPCRIGLAKKSKNVRHGDDERAECLSILYHCQMYSSMLISVSLTDSNTLGVDSAEIGIFKEGD